MSFSLLKDVYNLYFIFEGDHYSKLSILGCKYRLYPEKPVKRKMIRGSIFGVKIITAPFVASVALALGAGVLAVGCICLPVYGSYLLVKHIKVIFFSLKLLRYYNLCTIILFILFYYF